MGLGRASPNDDDLDARRGPRRSRRALMTRSQPAPPQLPRYERGDGSSRRYWQILRRGATITTWFGRDGQPPRTISRTLADASAAKRAYRALVALKRAHGYTLSSRPREHVSTSVRGTCLANHELLLALENDPNDEGSYLVYADWLQARGDPRGE